MNSHRFIIQVSLKTLLLLVLCNLVYAAFSPHLSPGNISAYNSLYPGRWRLPWGENPSVAYNLTLNDLNAMFNAHEISASHPENEVRVFMFGDSSIWGFLLPKEETLAAQLNAMNLTTADGRPLRFYNLGYPTVSLTKDLLLMDYAMRYKPDLVIWFVTLEAFPYRKQIFTPLVQNNPDAVRALISQHNLALANDHPEFNTRSFAAKTLFGQRRAIADWLHLQLYGVPWSATGADQDIPAWYQPLSRDYEADHSYYDFTPQTFTRQILAFDVLKAGVEQAGNTPILIVNQPIFISDGKNSEIRYNFMYPRWAYDAYREMMAANAQTHDWQYLDLWNSVPPEEFTNTAIHISANGTHEVALSLQEVVTRLLSVP